jgi:hypothetical protein
MDGGWSIGQENVVVRAPVELHMPWARYLDGELLEAAYRIFKGEQSGDGAFARRLELAATWLAQAWRNTDSVRSVDRIVMLKTGFEALTGERTTYAAAMWLERRFSRLRAGVTDLMADHLLWSPSESQARTFVDKRGRSRTYSDLVHWFCTFGEVRNEIIHEGSAKSLDYQAAGSAYCGNMVFVGERLLREAIRLSFEDFGYPHLWKQAAVREIAKAYAAPPVAVAPLMP